MVPNTSKRLLLLLIPALWLTASCEKDVTLDLPAGAPAAPRPDLPQTQETPCFAP